MAKYKCYIEADKSLYPVLLSNGNLIERGNLEVTLAFAAMRHFFHFLLSCVIYQLMILIVVNFVIHCRVVDIMPFGRIHSRSLATCLP